MASFDFNMPDGLKNELEAAANIERIAPKMLEAAAPVVVSAMKKRLSAHDKTGPLSASVKAGKVKYSSKHGGHSMAVNPTGKSSTYIDAKGRLKKRKKPERNMEKFASLEFGKSGQTATPIIRAVVKETENEVVKIMSDVYQKEAGL